MRERSVWIFGLLAAGAVGGAYGQAQSAAGSPIEELLAEVRGLRAELRSSADASLRGQLLVARLQLQEQRILSAARQLTEVQDKLATTEAARLPLAGQLKQFDEAQDALPADRRADMEGVKSLLKAQVEQFEKGAQELQAREAALQRVLSEEQARWTDFNARLDELEQTLPARRPR